MINTKHISFSELKVWNDCPYKHELVYGQAIPDFLGNIHTAFGSAAHAACEVALLDDKAKPYEVFKESFSEELKELEEKQIEVDSTLVEEMYPQAEKLCKNILSSLEEKFGEFQLISAEEKIYEPIEEFEIEETFFKGFIDLVIKTPDGKYHIIDWKTCSWGWDRRRRQSPMTVYQLVYYKNYFAKKHNIEPKKIETYFALLKRTSKNGDIEIFRVTSGKRRNKKSLKFLEKAVINIQRKNFIKNRLSCRYCKFYKTENCT